MNILLVGCGAVGSVMIQTLHHLSESHKFSLSITILARSENFRTEINDDIDYESIIIENILDFFEQPSDLDFDRVINTSLPEFNETIMQRALLSQINYMDLASDINETHIQKKLFPQSILAKQFEHHNICGLINCGISPGITEFCISYITKLHDIQPNSITIFLDENFNSLVPLFSRSPSVAITELLTPSVYLDENIYKTTKPFENVSICSTNKKQKRYIRITQEELISIKLQYPHIHSISMFVGGSEIEQSRLLYNLGLLTDPEIKEKLLKKLPGAAHKHDIIDAFEKNLIDDAGFSFKIELKEDNHTKTIEGSYDFEDFKVIQQGVYKGSTSISYPTGLSAAWILYLGHTYKTIGIHDCLSFSHNLPLEVLEDTRRFFQDNHIHITHD